MVKNKILLKVCGMRDPDNIRGVLQLQPDFMGFIFYGPSPRYVGEDFQMPDFGEATTKRVGVFVNAHTDEIMEKVRDFHLDFVQLHGNEPVLQCTELKRQGVGVIKVFSVDDEMDFKITEAYRDAADYFLFDTKGKYYGGNAVAFNWDMLSRYDQQVPFFLSGGISTGHVERIRTLDLYNLAAIDVNSGVEILPAMKDVNEIRALRAKLNSKN